MRGPVLSLWTGRAEFLRDDVVLADGDVLFAPPLLTRVVQAEAPNAFLAEPEFIDTGEEQILYILGGELGPPFQLPGASLTRCARDAPPRRGPTALPAGHPKGRGRSLSSDRIGPASPPDPVERRDVFHGARVVALRRGVMGPPAVAHDGRAEWVGFVKVGRDAGRELASALDAIVRGGHIDGDYERALDQLLSRHRFVACPTAGLPWIEIDYPQDLQAAESEILPRLEGPAA
jgi:hypothetical protein